MKILKLSDINLKEKISSKGCYGNIWLTEDNKIVKIQSLKTNIHYNKVQDIYYDSNNKEIKNSEAIKKYYNTPFSYYFRNKHSITLDEFNNEVNNQIYMSKHHIAPKIYKYGITKYNKNELQYGIIIMKKMPYILKNHLFIDDMSIVVDKINKMHSLGYYHGDLQTSNIGIDIKNGKITKCRIIDWFYSNIISSDNNIKSDFDLYKERGGKLINKDN
jgi:tRNA A-37 threonylcarbamoyl transferase component Bud32